MPEVHRLYCKYQKSVHGDEDPYEGAQDGMLPSELEGDGRVRRFGQDSSDSDSDDSMSDQSSSNSSPKRTKLSRSERQAKLNKGYKSFHRFLCASPFQPVPYLPQSSSFARTVDGRFQVAVPYGTYHLQYRIGGVLVAVSVLDVLPRCMSSVYCFYDPAVSGRPARMELGKYTALYEIEWVRRAREVREELKYYYLGFYIHSCEKMKYKAGYRPSEIRCPVTGEFVDYEEVKDKFDTDPTHRMRLASDSVKVRKPPSASRLNDIVPELSLRISQMGGEEIKLGMLNDYGQGIIKPMLDEMVEKVGEEIATNIVIKF